MLHAEKLNTERVFGREHEVWAVGMRCREALLSLVRELADGSVLGRGDDLPKVADFIAWNERIANAVAQGDRAEYVRGYIKSVAAWKIRRWGRARTRPAATQSASAGAAGHASWPAEIQDA